MYFSRRESQQFAVAQFSVALHYKVAYGIVTSILRVYTRIPSVESVKMMLITYTVHALRL